MNADKRKSESAFIRVQKSPPVHDTAILLIFASFLDRIFSLNKQS